VCAFKRTWSSLLRGCQRSSGVVRVGVSGLWCMVGGAQRGCVGGWGWGPPLGRGFHPIRKGMTWMGSSSALVQPKVQAVMGEMGLGEVQFLPTFHEHMFSLLFSPGLQARGEWVCTPGMHTPGRAAWTRRCTSRFGTAGCSESVGRWE